MKTSSSFAFALGAFLVSTGALAQERAPSEAATAEQRLVEDLGLERVPYGLPVAPRSSANVTTLSQIGDDNKATVTQQSLASPTNQAYVVQAGASNTLDLTQAGANNSATLNQQGNTNSARVYQLLNASGGGAIGNTVDFTQKGNANSTTITQQGSYNKLTGLVDGNNNEVNVLQQGNNNTVNGRIYENDRTYDIKQYGNNNTLNQFESTTQAPKGYNVEMRGNGINLTIEQSKVLPRVN